MYRFIDLFAGIGGFHMALKQRGMECVFASEIDKAASSAYAVNFGYVPRGDISQISSESIPPHDILCAGFPCQPFSISGKRGGFSDERGRLFYEIVRIAHHHQPQMMILENVKTTLTLDSGNICREIYQRLDAIGYRLDHVLLNLSDYGIPQQRERVYFVAILKGSPMSFSAPRPTGRRRYIKDILLPDSLTKGLVIERDDIVIEKRGKQPLTSKPNRVGYVNKGGQGERIYSPNGVAITLSANGGGVGHRTGLYLVNGKVRRLHIDEAKAVMGFKKGHVVSEGVSGYRQLGNAVSPPMVGTIYDHVRIDEQQNKYASGY